jgi:phosphohistidine phosphatase
MKKTVVLLRHGKSDWGASYSTDLARPLASRGRRAAPLVGRYLGAVCGDPDLLLTSPALRAHDTARLVHEAAGWRCPVETVDALYGASPDVVVDVVRGVDGGDLVVLVGHEPAWSATVSALIGGGAVRMPTAAAACVRFPLDAFAEVGFGLGTLSWLVTPKTLGRYAGA